MDTEFPKDSFQANTVPTSFLGSIFYQFVNKTDETITRIFQNPLLSFLGIRLSLIIVISLYFYIYSIFKIENEEYIQVIISNVVIVLHFFTAFYYRTTRYSLNKADLFILLLFMEIAVMCVCFLRHYRIYLFSLCWGRQNNQFFTLSAVSRIGASIITIILLSILNKGSLVQQLFETHIAATTFVISVMELGAILFIDLIFIIVSLYLFITKFVKSSSIKRKTLMPLKYLRLFK